MFCASRGASRDDRQKSKSKGARRGATITAAVDEESTQRSHSCLLACRLTSTRVLLTLLPTREMQHKKLRGAKTFSAPPSLLALSTDSGTRSPACGLLEQSCGSSGGGECVVLVFLAVRTVDTVTSGTKGEFWRCSVCYAHTLRFFNSCAEHRSRHGR
jgi:hypothetical protein